MKPSVKLETQINLPGTSIKLDEVEVNMICFGNQPDQSKRDNYFWDWSISVATDTGDDNDEPFDQLTCYINGELIQQGDKYFLIKINTLHTYQLPKLKYKKAHDEIFKSIARESVAHANVLLNAETKGTAYQGYTLPEPDEDFLSEDAAEWNKRGYIPQASKPNENAFGKKPTPAEIKDLSNRSAALVKWIDEYDDRGGPQTDEERTEYFTKYAEWVKLNNLLWHFKLIARNQIAYMLTKMMVKMEKALEETPDNYDLIETYEGIKEEHDNFMQELKEEFAKN